MTDTDPDQTHRKLPCAGPSDNDSGMNRVQNVYMDTFPIPGLPVTGLAPATEREVNPSKVQNPNPVGALLPFDEPLVSHHSSPGDSECFLDLKNPTTKLMGALPPISQPECFLDLRTPTSQPISQSYQAQPVSKVETPEHGTGSSPNHGGPTRSLINNPPSRPVFPDDPLAYPEDKNNEYVNDKQSVRPESVQSSEYGSSKLHFEND